MRLNIILTFIITTFSICYMSSMNSALDSIPKDSMVMVEEMPLFQGCEDVACSKKEIAAFIGSNVEYPQIARENGIQGIAVIQFIIEKDGSISFLDNPILKDPGGGTGKEALRVVKSMTDWTPGKHQGKPARVMMTLPVKFKLEDRKKRKKRKKKR